MEEAKSSSTPNKDSLTSSISTDSNNKRDAESNAADSSPKKLKQIPNEKGFAVIEGDAAEDKGSRHFMEDKWVVLNDADSPEVLRLPFPLIYLFIYFGFPPFVGIHVS